MPCTVRSSSSPPVSSTWTVSPISTSWSSASSTSTMMPSSVEVVDRALLHAGVEDAVEAARVDRREELLDRLAVGVGDLGRREACGHDRVDAVDLGDLLGDRRREAAEAAEAAALALHDEVAGEPAADLLVDRRLGGRREHGDEADQGDADEERRRGGRRALRAAGGVLRRRACPVMPSQARQRRPPSAGRSGPASTGPTMMAPTITSRAAPRPTVGMASVSPSPVHACASR